MLNSSELRPASQKMLAAHGCTHHRLVLEERVLCDTEAMIVYPGWEWLM